MKKFFPAVLLSCALSVPAALTASTFEGKVHIQTSHPKLKDSPQGMDMLIKEDLVRIDPQAAAGSIIIDGKKQEMTMLMNERQMYMIMPLKAQEVKPTPTAKSQTHEMTDKAPTSAPAMVTTGEHEKILGYDTEKFVMKKKETTDTIWLTSDLGSFMGLGAGAGGMGSMGGGRRGGNNPQVQAWEEALKGKNVFPMRVVTTDLAGIETYRMDVTAVEKKSLSDSDFAPPAGWQKFEMPNISELMKNMGH